VPAGGGSLRFADTAGTAAAGCRTPVRPARRPRIAAMVMVCWILTASHCRALLLAPEASRRTEIRHRPRSRTSGQQPAQCALISKRANNDRLRAHALDLETAEPIRPPVMEDAIDQDLVAAGRTGPPTRAASDPSPAQPGALGVPGGGMRGSLPRRMVAELGTGGLVHPDGCAAGLSRPAGQSCCVPPGRTPGRAGASPSCRFSSQRLDDRRASRHDQIRVFEQLELLEGVAPDSDEIGGSTLHEPPKRV
jgi:hypothetical protein